MYEALKNVVNKGIYGKTPLEDVRYISTIRDLFLSSTELFSENIIYLTKFDPKEDYREIKYKEFRQDVFNFATALIDMGLKGKRIGIIGDASYMWAVGYISVVCGVGTIVPLDRELPQSDIENLSSVAELDAIIYSQKVNKGLDGYFDRLEGITTISMTEKENAYSMPSLMKKGAELIENGDTSFEDAKVEPDDVNIILFTSGTTGYSKGVMLSHRNVASNVINICTVYTIKEFDRMFSILPIHHTYECTCGFLCPMFAGSSVAHCSGLKYILKEVKEAKPTIIVAVPLIMEMFHKGIMREVRKQGKEKTLKFGVKLAKFMDIFGIDIRKKLFGEIHAKFGGRLRDLLVGAAPVNPETSIALNDLGIKTIQGYGLTECAPLITANRQTYFRHDSVGLPVPEDEVKIVNPDEEGIGEIAVKGENVMVGYYKDEELTKSVIRDGFFHTGDLGYIKDGFVYITGRLKNVIITENGKNVFPEEIEGRLCESGIVSDAFVYESEEGGKKVITAQIFPDEAYVKENLGEKASFADIRARIEEIIKKLNSEMVSYKSIKKLIVRKTDFIRTTTKKIKRADNIDYTE